MSHLRNLLYSSAGPAPVASATSLAAPEMEPVTTSDPDVPPARAAEFPSEEAHFTAESRMVCHTQPRSAAADRFRLLRMRLKEQGKSGKLKKLLITSPLAGDGKSTVVLNLATVLSERGRKRVLIVESDLYHSSLTEILRLKTWPGLTECLSDDKISPLSAVRRIEPFGWHLLPAGEPRRNPTELLQTPALGRVMQQLEPCFDWILVDSPPVMPLTDSLLLKQQTDGTLLVVRAERTPREAVEQTVDLLGKKNIVAIVLNSVQAGRNQYGEYYAGIGRQSND
jgi:protein-tyrosine kinase